MWLVAEQADDERVIESVAPQSLWFPAAIMVVTAKAPLQPKGE